MQKVVSSDQSKHSPPIKTKKHLIAKDWKRNWPVYLILLLPLSYIVIFNYIPMAGLVIAFENFSFRKGYFNSPFVGFSHFDKFFSSMYFGRTLTNTLMLSMYGFIFSVPSSILLALLLNEVRSTKFKRTTQTISYLPYFVSMVVVVGILQDFCKSNGLITQAVNAITGESNSNLLGQARFFRGLFIGSNIWQHVGYNSIIYLSALSSVDPEMYEAARIDGAGRLRQTWHVTLPGISSTIIILLILRVGEIMTLDYEKVLLMYTPATYSTSDIIQTYVYRTGMENGNYSYATAVGLFNSIVNIILIVLVNKISRRVSETSLW